MACLANAAENKVEFCAQYGIQIEPEQWPSRGVPDEIITDQGREFTGERMNEFCTRYGTELQVLPPFRPDRKGIVEKPSICFRAAISPCSVGKVSLNRMHRSDGRSITEHRLFLIWMNLRQL